MKYFAKKEGFGDEAEFWGIVGILHDINMSKKAYHGDFNSWKELFNAHREENAKLFYTTRYALYFSDIHTPNAGEHNEDRNR